MYITFEFAHLNSGEMIFLRFAVSTANETNVGGTSKSLNEPDILSLPPIAARSN